MGRVPVRVKDLRNMGWTDDEIRKYYIGEYREMKKMGSNALWIVPVVVITLIIGIVNILGWM